MSVACSPETRRHCPDPKCAAIDGCRHDYRDMAPPVKPELRSAAGQTGTKARAVIARAKQEMGDG